MQSLRSTSVRRLYLSATVSVTRTRPTLQLPALFCHTRPFASSSPRWDSSASQFHRQTIQEMKEEPSDVEGAERCVTPPPFASHCALTILHQCTNKSQKCKQHTVYWEHAVLNYGRRATGNILRIRAIAQGSNRCVPASSHLSYFHALTFFEAKNNKGMPMGYAHIDFESKEAAIKANKDHQESPMTIGDREIRMDYAFPATHKGGPPPPRRAVKDRFEPCPTIFIGGVPYEATRDDIRESLKPLGEVVAVRICALPRIRTFERYT